MGRAKPGPAQPGPVGPWAEFFLNKKPWVGRADSKFQRAPMRRNGPNLKKKLSKDVTRCH